MAIASRPLASLPLASDVAAGGGGNYTGTLVAGSKVITGQILTLVIARNLTLVAGGKVITGQTLTLAFARNLTLVANSKVLTGQVLSLALARNLTLVAGNKPLSGQTLTLAFARNLTLVPGSLVKTGQALTLQVPFTGTLVPGSLIKTGGVLTLVRTGIAGVTPAGGPTGPAGKRRRKVIIGDRAYIVKNDRELDYLVARVLSSPKPIRAARATPKKAVQVIVPESYVAPALNPVNVELMLAQTDNSEIIASIQRILDQQDEGDVEMLLLAS